ERELRLIRFLERRVVQGAAAVTSTSAAVANLLMDRYPDRRRTIHVVRNGYDGSVISAPSDTGGRLSILFAGELYFGRNPFPMLSAIEELLERPEVDRSRIEVTLMGKVQTYGDQSVAAWLKGRRCASIVTLMPPQSSEVVASKVAQSTVVLNLAQRQPL